MHHNLTNLPRQGQWNLKPQSPANKQDWWESHKTVLSSLSVHCTFLMLETAIVHTAYLRLFVAASDITATAAHNALKTKQSLRERAPTLLPQKKTFKARPPHALPIRKKKTHTHHIILHLSSKTYAGVGFNSVRSQVHMERTGSSSSCR